ncbi:MAG: PmbA protein [Alphaproteobacteria bacterium]|jgi:PmbA protein
MSNLDICRKAVKLAKKLGASDAECEISTGESMSISAFGGKSEGLSGKASIGLNITAYMGQKVGSFTVNDLSNSSVEDAVKTAILMAKGSPENQYEGVADKSLIQPVTAEMLKQLDQIDTEAGFTPAEMLQMACEMEQSALAVAGVQSTRSSKVSQSTSLTAIAISNGFEAEEGYTIRSAFVDPIAAQGDLKVTGYDYHYAFHKADLDAVAKIGQTAGEKTAAMLKQVKMPKTGKMPVLLSPEMAAQMLKGCISSCLSGGAIYAEQSFVSKDDLGKQLFGKNINLLDNRTIPRGLGSSAFTGSGIVGPESVHLIKDGVIENLTMGVVTARKLGMSPALGRPALYNGYFKPGLQSVSDISSDIKLGFYVTGMMGNGFNAINGDLSYTVEGYIIRNGIISDDFVLEATVAGNIKDMLNNVTFANNLMRRNGIDASTARVDGLTIG